MTMQDTIENEMIDTGVNRYHKARTEAEKHFSTSDLPPLRLLRNKLLDSVVEGISEELMSNLGKAGNNHAVLVHLAVVEPVILAHYALTGILNSITKGRKLMQVASLIGEAIQYELECQNLASNDAGLYEYLLRQMKSYKQHEKDSTIRHLLKKLKKRQIHWSPEERVRIGVKLIEIVQRKSDMFTIETLRANAVRSYKIIKPTHQFLNWLHEAHHNASMLNPYHMPMVDRPDPWVSIYEGGYKSASLKNRFPLIKNAQDNYLEDMNNTASLSSVLQAVNVIQDTPWVVNKGVLMVMNYFWEQDMSVAKLPKRDPRKLPAKPAWLNRKFTKEEWNTLMSDTDKSEEYSKYRLAEMTITDSNARLISKRTAIQLKLNQAKRFIDSTLYFPHAMDWRGRLYPMSSGDTLNPQSSDAGKALLRFKHGLPIGEEGEADFLINLANMFGYDKVSNEDRIAWVKQNEEHIMRSAASPTEYLWWTDADKPFSFLAACFEYIGYKIEGVNYVSHLPIAKDGSNNGLQHLGLIMRDEHVDVNIQPSLIPQDTYTTVADAVSLLLIKYMRSDNEEVKTMAEAWHGKITRKLVKQPVMTIAYGATIKGMADMMVSFCKEHEDDTGIAYLPKVNRQMLPKYTMWLARVIMEAIGQEIAGAVKAMDYMQSCAKLLAQNDMPVQYTLPDGFILNQNYKIMVSQRVKLKYLGKIMELKMKVQTPVMDKAKQSNGISPNIVHSLDSYMLRETARRLFHEGVTSFGFIHDSYAVHACHVPLMQKTLRQVAVDMYADTSFLSDFKRQLEDFSGLKLPEPPEQGTLDVSFLNKAEYFFA